MTILKLISFFPLIGGIGRQLYASCLFGKANSLYFRNNYQ